MKSKRPQVGIDKKKARNSRDRRVGPPMSPLERISTPPLSYFILLAAILLCYLPTLSYEFTRFDDDLIILDNIALYQDLSRIGSSFTKDAFNNDVGFAFYRPMQNLSFFIDAQFSGANPIGFKLTNLLLHFLVCLSLCVFFRLLKVEGRASFLAILLYAVHPLFNHAVIWIPSRGDLLIALFGMLSYITFLRYLESQRASYLILHAVTFFIAAFSKETALLLPLLFVLHVLMIQKEFKICRKHLLCALSWTLVVSGYLVCRAQVILAVPKKTEFGIEPFVSNLQTAPEFLAKFVLPIHLSVLPIFTPLAGILGSVVLVLLGWLAVHRFRSGDARVGVGVIWFLIFTAVTMLYRHELGKAAYDYLEHRAYLPMIGILWVLAILMQGGIRKWGFGRVFGSCAVVVILFGVLTLVGSRRYQNPMTFYSSAIASNPKGAMAYYNRAKYRKLIGDRSGAMADYDAAIRVKPDCADAYNNRGNARNDYGDTQGALTDYDEAIRLNGEVSRTYFNRGNVKSTLGDKEGAREDYSKAITLEPNYVKALNNRGAMYYGLGQIDPAYADFDRVIKIDPRFADAWRNRGSVKFRSKDLKGACADWQVGGQLGNREAARLVQQYCR